MEPFNKEKHCMTKDEFKKYEKAFKNSCQRCLGEEVDCISCIARISYYTLRSENHMYG